jgi:hypothetical protein
MKKGGYKRGISLTRKPEEPYFYKSVYQGIKEAPVGDPCPQSDLPFLGRSIPVFKRCSPLTEVEKSSTFQSVPKDAVPC